VAVADDHPGFRDGIPSMLATEPGMVCAGVAQNGDDTLELVRRERPDVLVADLRLPGLPVLALLRILGKTMPGLRVVIITLHATPFVMAKVFTAGAHAFMAREESFRVLVSFIRRVARGESGVHSEPPGGAASTSRITSREREVLCCLARGLSAEETGNHLGIDRRTMEMYRARLRGKLGADAVAALRLGSPPPG
jgi:DNA-binding NarL/FixJ family response regulator